VNIKVKYAVPVNLRGEKIGDRLIIKNNAMTVALKAYEPVSFILQ
jgi:hypothetical protein